MANVRMLDMKLIDDLFEMGGGNVLDFSIKTICIYFAEELNVDLYSPVYEDEGTSKAKRVRCFLKKSDTPTAVTALNSLWDYRKQYMLNHGRREWVRDADLRFRELLNRIQGIQASSQAPSPAPSAPPPSAPPAVDARRLQTLKAELLALASMEPQPRGYAFERFLTALFNLFKLEAREPFRLRGEQIDGSFELAHETYLFEAKWQNQPTQAADLHVFHGKIEQKAAWTRGLFVSNSGFSPDGLHAFGRGKRLICMDGLDIHDALSREIPLNEVLMRKVRKASETGFPFHHVRDLF